MKKFFLLLLCLMLIGAMLTSCKNVEIANAKETPALLFAQRIISGLYGEASYQYEEIENELSSSVEDGWMYDDLTFFQVYKDKKPFCKIAVNPNTLKNGVKTPEMSQYKQAAVGPDGSFVLTDTDL